MKNHLPNILTLLRIGTIPLIVGLFFWNHVLSVWLATTLFIGACITDYVDGYLARSFNKTSRLGRILDPLADKLLVTTLLLLLTGSGMIQGVSLIPALIILLREMFVSGLRECLGDVKGALPVGSLLSKWKTALQMVSLCFFLISRHGVIFAPFKVLGVASLWGAAFLSFVTGYRYFKTSYHFLKKSAPFL